MQDKTPTAKWRSSRGKLNLNKFLVYYVVDYHTFNYPGGNRLSPVSNYKNTFQGSQAAKADAGAV